MEYDRYIDEDALLADPAATNNPEVEEPGRLQDEDLAPAGGYY